MRLTDRWESVRRAFAEFLAVPTLIIAGFLALAAATSALDHAARDDPGIIHAFMRAHVFRDSKSTADLLDTIASGIITVTSITFSVLLLAVQQSAASLTNQVFDQFLRRRLNQAFFGSFVGLALYALIVLATVDVPYNPIYGATLALILTVAALYMLIVLIYSTIDQMRPSTIIEAIRSLTLRARECQGELLRVTRRLPATDDPVRERVHVERNGFVVRVDVDAIAREAARIGGVEVVLVVAVGEYVGFQDVVAEFRADDPHDFGPLADVVRRAVVLESQRDLDHDPAFGVEQLHIIAWTSISTAKSNPAPGLLSICALRDLLARWVADGGPPEAGDSRGVAPTPIVYRDDAPDRILDALESLTVAASESMQHQSLAEILDSLSLLYARLPGDMRRRIGDIVMRALAALGDHAPTARLDGALSRLADTLDAASRPEVAACLRAAQRRLDAHIGRLGSRSTRADVPP